MKDHAGVKLSSLIMFYTQFHRQPSMPMTLSQKTTKDININHLAHEKIYFYHRTIDEYLLLFM